MQKITNYFNQPKKRKLDEQSQKCLTSPVILDQTASLVSSSSSVNLSSSVDGGKEGDKHWPDCWTFEQKSEHCRKNDWLIVQNKQLGCDVCRKVGSLGVEK
uniref:Uncharacterized protein LOC114329547 n=1 Tax=Diabrotica virgifera virgifera TaxID=50390 RepID=A0A6P7FNA9_DIAVI